LEIGIGDGFLGVVGGWVFDGFDLGEEFVATVGRDVNPIHPIGVLADLDFEAVVFGGIVEGRVFGVDSSGSVTLD
jgi:hypothetical protein